MIFLSFDILISKDRIISALLVSNEWVRAGNAQSDCQDIAANTGCFQPQKGLKKQIKKYVHVGP